MSNEDEWNPSTNGRRWSSFGPHQDGEAEDSEAECITDDGNHGPWRTVSAEVEGHGSMMTGVIQECRSCGALRFQKRPEAEADYRD